MYKNILVTGGAGFIGSSFIRESFGALGFEGEIVNLDALTYAGSTDNIEEIEEEFASNGRYHFVHGDICDEGTVTDIFKEHEIDCVVHFAAESHVDRSIEDPFRFAKTNILGTMNLLEVARKFHTQGKFKRFHHVSTDEVYGSLGQEGFFYEDTPYDPRSPYSASKASSDHFVRAYQHTYHLPVTLSNCSNNYGPFQFPEKLIPVIIQNIINEAPLPVYGDGKNIRDWLYVSDHSSALWSILHEGREGETYNIGGENEWTNIDLVTRLCKLMAKHLGRDEQKVLSLISFVKDRPGHDRRYAIDCKKAKVELGWSQVYTFESGLEDTVKWYIENQEWVKNRLEEASK